MVSSSLSRCLLVVRASFSNRVFAVWSYFTCRLVVVWLSFSRCLVVVSSSGSRGILVVDLSLSRRLVVVSSRCSSCPLLASKRRLLRAPPPLPRPRSTPPCIAPDGGTVAPKAQHNIHSRFFLNSKKAIITQLVYLVLFLLHVKL